VKLQLARIWRRLGWGLNLGGVSLASHSIKYRIDYKWIFVVGVAILGSLFIPGTKLPHALAVLEDTCDGVCAEGFYTASTANSFTGAQANIELAWPQVGDSGNTMMRLAVKDTALSDTNNGWFAGIGWHIGTPFVWDNHRHVVASWSDYNTLPTGGWHDFGYLSDTDANTYNYRVAELSNKPLVYRWRWNGTNRFKQKLTFKKTTTVLCGGNASSAWNAIGIAACINVQYSNTDWSLWVLLPSHQKRVTAGYQVANMGPASWQSSGNNQ
jgi:hypothetical protein